MPSTTKPVKTTTTKKTSASKAKKSVPKKVVEPVVEPELVVEHEPVVEPEPVIEPEIETVTPENVAEPVVVEENKADVSGGIVLDKKTKNKIDKETYLKKWDELFEIYTDILKTRKQPHQNVSLFNYLKSLKQDTQKLLRVRNTNNVNRNTSGFMKPVNISDELRKFIDLKESENEEPITRVLITQKLCQYIKEKNLQKPEDKREILPDDGLKKLFNITPDETEKLTYYSMQKKVQSHIFKI